MGCATAQAVATARAAALHLHAFFGVIFYRARMPRDRRVRRDLLGKVDVLGFAVHRDQIVLVLDEGLDDRVGDLIGHAGVGDQDVLHRRDLIVLVLARIG